MNHLLHYRGDDVVRFKGPTDFQAQTAIDTPVSAVLRVFERVRQTAVREIESELTETAADGATSIVLPALSPQPIEDGDALEIELSDGSTHETTASGAPVVDATSTTVSIGDALGAAAIAGARVRVPVKAAGGTLFAVADGRAPIDVRHTVEIVTDTGAVLSEAVVSIRRLEATGTGGPIEAHAEPWVLQVGTGSSEAVSAGNQVRRQLGAEVDISGGIYGTPSPNDETWGFAGSVPDDDPDVRPKMIVQIECVFDGGAGLRKVESIDALVV